MTFALTATVSRPIIDLTGEAPRKRRRVDNGGTRRRGLRECLQYQLLPHISAAVRELPEGVFNEDAIGIQVGAANCLTRWVGRG